MALSTDTFTRANETPLGGDPTSGNWTETRLGSSAKEFNLASNVVTTPSQDGEVFWNSVAFGSDQYSQAVLTCSVGVAGEGPGLGLRLTSAATGYRVVFSHAGTNNVEFGRIVATAYTQIESFTQAWTDGDTWKIQVTGATNAAIVKAFLNGSLVHTFTTDNSSTVAATGQPGLTYSSSGVGTIDNWEGGDVTSSSFLPSHITQRLQAVNTAASW